ncbi:unnamed protein product [Ectocarpus sp. 4 AP-2014]
MEVIPLSTISSIQTPSPERQTRYQSNGGERAVLMSRACPTCSSIDHVPSIGRSIVPTGPITDGQSLLPTLPNVAKGGAGGPYSTKP